MACYRLSGCSAYRVHAIIRLTTAASLTHEAAQPQEPLSTELSCRAVFVGPDQTPSEACSEARKMGRQIDTVAGMLDSTWTWQVITFILLAPTVFPGQPTMFGPGEYVPDSTEGLVDVKDLPAPQLGFYSRDHKQTPCPRCGHLASRHTSEQRTVHDLGDVCTGRPVDLLVTDSSHYCSTCRKHFNIDLSD